MVATGFHVLMGIALSNVFFKNNRNAKMALVITSALPDIDLLGSAIIYLMTKDNDLTIGFHRTITHSWLVYLLLLLAGLVTSLIYKTRSLEKSKTIRDVTFGGILGLFFHTIFDLIYLSDVAIFWPIITTRFKLLPFTYEVLDPMIQKFLNSFDLLVDLGLYLTLMTLAIHLQTDITWIKRLKIVSIIYATWNLIFLAIAFLPLTPEDHVIYQYEFGGLVFLVFTMFLPLFMANTSKMQDDLPLKFNLRVLLYVFATWVIAGVTLTWLSPDRLLMYNVFVTGIFVLQLIPIGLALKAKKTLS